MMGMWMKCNFAFAIHMYSIHKNEDVCNVHIKLFFYSKCIVYLALILKYRINPDCYVSYQINWAFRYALKSPVYVFLFVFVQRFQNVSFLSWKAASI